jgi:hypothetical protein
MILVGYSCFGTWAQMPDLFGLSDHTMIGEYCVRLCGYCRLVRSRVSLDFANFGFALCRRVCLITVFIPGLSQRRTDRHVRPSVTSDKALVRQIRVNTMLTSDRIKSKLFCPRWLPHRCHVGSLAITL